MYAHFYQLSENPFNLTPDPKFHYINESTREAMASIQHGIKSRKGFITLIGEAGTGKTTLLKRVVEEIEGETTIVFVFNPGVSFDELLEFICTELGIEVGATRRLHLLEKLNAFLLEQLTDGRNVVVMIDEAQTLDDGVLEELRLLSNLETSKEKILQILLSGQPELEEKLRRPNLRQLRQRIAARATLRPMQAKEMGAYVETRMKSAGAERNDFFTPRALKKIWQVSAGIPRVINVICDNAMMIAFAEGKRQITSTVLKEAIRDLQGEADSISAGDTVRSITQNQYIRFAAAAALILGIGVPLWLSGGDWMGDGSTPEQLAAQSPAPNRVPEPIRALPPLPTEMSNPLGGSLEEAEVNTDDARAERLAADARVATGGMAPSSAPAVSELDTDPALRDSVLNSIRRARLLARSTAARLYDSGRKDKHDQDAPNIVEAARSEMSPTTQGSSLAAAAAARREMAAIAAERSAKLSAKQRADGTGDLSVAANLEPFDDMDPFGDDVSKKSEAAPAARLAREAEAGREAEAAAREAETVAREADVTAREADVTAREAEAARQAEIVAREAEAARQAEVAAREAEAARQAEVAAREAEAARQAEVAAREAEAARQAEVAAREAEAARQAEIVAREAEAARQAEIAAREAEAARQAEIAAREAEAARQAEVVAREAEAARKAERIARKAELKRKAEQEAREAELTRKAADAERDAAAARKAQQAAFEVEAAHKAQTAAAMKEIEAARRAEAIAKKEAAAAKQAAARTEAEAAEVAVAARAAATAAAEASAAAVVAAKAAAQAQADRGRVPDAFAADPSLADTPDGGVAGDTPASDADTETQAESAAVSAETGAELAAATLSARQARERQLAKEAEAPRQAGADEPIAAVGRPVRIRALGPAGGEPLIGQLVRIQEGDTIWDIAVEHYGDAGPSTYERVLASNPGIRNAKRLSVGAFIFMPFQNPDQMIHRDGDKGYRVLVSAAPSSSAVDDARTWVRSILKGAELGTATDTGRNPAVYELYAIGLPSHDAAFDVAVRVLSEYGQVRGGKRLTAQR